MYLKFTNRWTSVYSVKDLWAKVVTIKFVEEISPVEKNTLEIIIFVVFSSCVNLEDLQDNTHI